MEYFEQLTEQEIEKLVNSISYITIYIAGADGNIDTEEKEWAEKLTKIRSYASPNDLHEFYERVGQDYAERLDSYIIALPNDVAERTTQIEAKLAELNPILAKLNTPVDYHVYKSLTSFAEHVAKASGGFLRFGAISKEEGDLIGLDMLTPIAEPEEEV